VRYAEPGRHRDALHRRRRLAVHLSSPIIASQALYLAGGKDGDNIQTWHVEGSVAGALPAYLLDIDTPTPYSSGALGFSIAPGAIPFEAGDSFRWSIEGGHWRWRKDGGAWSSSAPISDAPVALDSGLSAQLQTGAAPSFVAADMYSFRALQPHAVSNAIDPGHTAWRWTGSSVSLVADLGGTKSIDCAMIAFHALVPGAVVTIQGGADGVTWDWSETITRRPGVMASLFQAHTAAFLRITITGAADGSIGWAWAGLAFATEHSAEVSLQRDYSITRAAGLLPSAAFQASAMSGSIEWADGALGDEDMPGLANVLDWVKSSGDEPMIIIPHALRPGEAYPVRVVDDQIEQTDAVTNYQANDPSARRYEVKLQLKGVPA
jgi:hypothetical protein